MAIAFDAAGEGFTNSSSGSLTYSHTCTGSDRILSVVAGGGAGTTITGITYNGTAMTLVDSYTAVGISVDNIYLYILVNPTSGANNVVVSASGSGALIYSESASYTGAKQTAQPPHTAKNTGTGTSLTTTLNTSTAPSTDNCWVIGGYLMDGNFNVSAGASTTIRSTGSVKNWLGIMDSNAAVTPAGSRSLIFNSSSSCPERAVIASIAPVTAPVPVASDSSTLSDIVAIVLVGLISATDSTAISDSINVQRNFTISKSDSVSVTDAIVARLFWLNGTKHTSTMSNQALNTSIWTDSSKNDSTFTTPDRNL